MSHKIAGIIFILFGAGLMGDSVQQLYDQGIEMTFNGVKPVIAGFLGLASCIYGYKRTKTVPVPPSE